MTTDKLTERKIYTAIANGTLEDLDVDAVVEWAEKKIAQLDRKAVKAKENAEKKKAEGDALAEQIKTVLTDVFETIADIATRIEDEDATISKISYRLNALSKDPESGVEKGEVLVKDDKGKTKHLVGYKINM